MGLCSRCNGTGEEPNWKEFGVSMKAQRKQAKVHAYRVADRMGISPTYISDLENGKRAWGAELTRKYLDALKELR